MTAREKTSDAGVGMASGEERLRRSSGAVKGGVTAERAVPVGFSEAVIE